MTANTNTIPLIQAALNGVRAKEQHTAVPISIEELARDAAACVAAGAEAIHLHPRDKTGDETLDPAIVNALVTRVREASGVPVGVTTGEWIEPELEQRLAMIRGWRAPDYTSVNVSEIGSVEVMHALIAAGVGIEAGIATVDEASALIATGLSNRILRILIEPGEEQVGESGEAAQALVSDIHRILDEAGIDAPRLQHGSGRVTWPVLQDALARGLDTRIGLEDTLVEPDGTWTAGNAALVRTARLIRDGNA